MKEFYHFSNLVGIQQPDKTNWCWAICFEVLVKQLLKTKVSSMNACNFVLDYLAFTEKPVLNNSFCTDFQIENDSVPEWADITINESENLCSFLNNYDLNVEEQKTTSFSDAEFFKVIVELLHGKGLPLLTKKAQGLKQYAHLRLITGYGKYKECCYVLLMDSLSKDEVYMPLSIFRESLSKIWSIDVGDDIELPNFVEDIDTKKELIHIENLIENFNRGRDRELSLNPIIFLQRNIDFLRFGLHRNFNQTVEMAIDFLESESKTPSCTSPLIKNSYISKISHDIPPIKLEEIDELLEKMKLYQIEGGLFLVENVMIKINPDRDLSEANNYNFEIVGTDNQPLETTIFAKNNIELKQQITNFLK